MTKRLIISVSLFFLSISIFASNVNDLNGFDWRTWTNEQRVSFMIGFISANNMMLEYMYFQSKDNEWDQVERDKFRKMMEDQFGYEVNISDVCVKIDKFYDIYDNRTFRIWQIILYAYGKDFWSKSSNKSTSGGGA